MTLLDLVAKITLDKSEYEKGLAGLKADVDKKAKALQTGMLKVTGAGVAALGAFAVSSVKTGATFDKAMSQVSATLGLTMDEMKSQVGEVDTAYGKFSGNMREYAKFMGEHTAFSASQSAEALNYMALAGYTAQESMEMLPNVLSLAAAGNMDLARASDMVTDAQTAFAIDMEDMPALIDRMAKAASTGNTSVEQLGDAYLTVGGLAQELNGGFVTLADGTKAPVDGIDELTIALTAMANAGVKGSEGGTHMRNMLLKLASPTSEGTKQLEALNVAVFDTEGNMRSLKDIFGDLSGALDNLTQEEKIQAISNLFNTRDLASAEALLNAVQSDWDAIGEAILDSEGAAQKMADTQLDNLSGDVTLLKSAFEGFKIRLSDKLTPALRKGVQAITNLIQNFDKIAPILVGAATAFGVFAVAINITSIVQKVGVAIKALFTVLAANPVALVIAAIAGLVAAFVTLYKNNEDFRNKVDEIWGQIKEIAASAWEAIKEYAAIAWGVIQSIWDAVAPYFEAVWATIQGIFSVVQSVFEGDFQGAWDAIKGIIDVWAEYFGKVWDDIKAVFDTALDLGKDIVDKIWQGVQEGWGAFKEWVAGAWESIKSIFTIDIKWPFGGGRHAAIGMDYVPSNNYPAVLHKGEAVLTAHEAKEWRGGNQGGRSSQPIQVQVSAPVVLDGAVIARQTYDFMLNLDNAHGVSLINA